MLTFQICATSKIKNTVARRWQYRNVWEKNIGSIREKVEQLLQSKRGTSNEVSNQVISLANNPSIRNIIEDAVSIPKDELPRNSNDLKNIGDNVVAVSTINFSTDVDTPKYEDLQNPLLFGSDVINVVDGAEILIPFPTYADTSKDNDPSACYVFSPENETDVGVFVSSDVVASLEVPPPSPFNEGYFEKVFTSREAHISDVERKITFETQAEVSFLDTQVDGAGDFKSISTFTDLENNESVGTTNRDSDDDISIIGNSATDCTMEKHNSNNWNKTTKDADSTTGNKVFLVEFHENTGFTTKELPDVAPRAANPIAPRIHTSKFYFAGKQFVVPSNLFKNTGVEKLKYDESKKSFRTVKEGADNINNNAIRDFIHQLMISSTSYKCTLHIYSIRKNGSRGVVAYARCRYKSHYQKFKFEFDNINQEYATVFIYVEDDPKFTLPIVHSGKPKMVQLRNQERIEVKDDLQHTNPQLYYDKVATEIDTDLAHEGNYQNLRHEATYRKARTEDKIKSRKSIVSSDLSNIIQKCVDDYTSRDPYIRFAGVPFRIQMYSRQQLNTVTKEDKIAHFDATGSIVRKPEIQVNAYKSDPAIHKVMLYYVMVYRKVFTRDNGEEKKKEWAKVQIQAENEEEEENEKRPTKKTNERGITIPLMEMVTCEHDIASIGNLLGRYRAFVETENFKWPLFKVIVVDWSWATIHAILREWLDTNIANYLQLTYDFLNHTKNIPTDFILIYYCCAHNQHRISKALKRNFSHYEKGKSIILDCTAIMLECTTLHELDKAYTDLVTILLTKSAITANAAMSRLNVFRTETSVDDEEDDENKYDDLIAYPDEIKYKTIYQDSPFFQHYKRIMAKIKKLLHDIEKNITEIENEYYNPEIAEYFTKNYMSYAPMWTAIVLNKIFPKLKRLSNATVEGYFNIVKHVLLKSKKNISGGDLTDITRNHINGICSRNELKEIFKDQRSIGKVHKKRYTDPDDAEIADDRKVEEAWARKATGQRPAKRKSYFEGRNLESALKKQKISFNRNDQNDKEIVSGSCISDSKRYDSFVTTELNSDGTISASPLKNSLLMETQASYSTNKTSSTDSINQHALPNGLFEDEQYYMQEIFVPGGLKGRSKDRLYYYMAQYACGPEIPIIGDKFMNLTSIDYRSLRPRAYISSFIVDCYATAKIASRAWNNITFIPAYETLLLLGDGWNRKKNKNWTMFQIKSNFDGIVLLPYVYKNHWMLLVLDVTNQTIKHIDPMSRCSTYRDKAVQAFKKYLSDCKTDGHLSNNLCNINWKILDDDEERPMQKDQCNCGSYVMYFLDCIATGKPLRNPSFQPNQFRKLVARDLLTLSRPMREVCYLCCERSSGEEWSVQCEKCKHYVHIDCVRKTEKDNTDYRHESNASYACQPCFVQNRPWMVLKLESDISTDHKTSSERTSSIDSR